MNDPLTIMGIILLGLWVLIAFPLAGYFMWRAGKAQEEAARLLQKYLDQHDTPGQVAENAARAAMASEWENR